MCVCEREHMLRTNLLQDKLVFSWELLFSQIGFKLILYSQWDDVVRVLQTWKKSILLMLLSFVLFWGFFFFFPLFNSQNRKKKLFRNGCRYEKTKILMTWSLKVTDTYSPHPTSPYFTQVHDKLTNYSSMVRLPADIGSNFCFPIINLICAYVKDTV